MVKGFFLDDIMLGVSALRNQNLANIFYCLNLIEAYGTGILKINENYQGNTSKPAIEATGNAFRITLPNMNFHKENNSPATDHKPKTASDHSTKKELLCKEKGYILRKDIQAELNIPQASAILLLHELTEAGVLARKGAARNLRYCLPER